MSFKNLIFVLLIAFVSVLSAGEIKKKAPSPDKTLMFFLNPYGGPCQYQLELLNKISDSLKKYCNVEHIRTDVPSDREKFGVWGIRGLPQIIVVDGNRKELFRFSAGVQDSKTILEKIRTSK